MAKYSNAKKKRRSTKPILIGVLILLFAILATVGYLIFVKNNKNKSSESTPVYSGPTEEEIKQGDVTKDDLVNEKPQYIEDNGAAPTNTTVTIADANQYGSTIEVRAFMPNSFEAGSCEVVFDKSGTKISKKVDAFLDNTYTLCSPLEIPRSELSASGTWKVTVNYSSVHYVGSASLNMELQ